MAAAAEMRLLTSHNVRTSVSFD